MAKEELAATNRIFEEEVVGKGNLGALAHVYTEGARLLPPGMPMVTGLSAIAAYWKGAATALGVTRAKLHTVELTITGDTAQELGRVEIFTRSGRDTPIRGKYVVLWKKEGGAWKWDVDCLNMDG